MPTVFTPAQIMKTNASDLLRDLDLTDEELLHLLDLAAEVKHSPRDYARALDGKSIALLFEKPSLRTRLTFELAIKQLGGDALFVRKAGRLASHASLTGWLYTSTRYAAASCRRREQRRLAREHEAHVMNTILGEPEAHPDWAQISQLLDEAMHQLDEREREVVLWRHFENRSYAEIGARCGASENAARMRVERALEKLHGILARQGVTLTVMAR